MSERDLDLLIDSALPAYVAEPMPGLADRVVTRTRRGRVGWLPVAGAVAAAALFAFAWLPRTVVFDRPVKLTGGQIEPPLKAVEPRAKQAETVAWQRPRRAVPAPAARPVPISPAELRLAQFVAQHPQLAEQVLAAKAPGPVEPLSAPEPIEIQPLSND